MFCILVLVKNGRIKVVALLLVLLLLLYVNAENKKKEIVTLQKQNHVECITDDLTSAIYVNPPIAEEAKNDINLLANEIWTDDDWLLVNASKSIQGPVTDKRWEDFPTIFTNHQHFTDKIFPSFSIYTTSDIFFYIYNEESINRIRTEVNNNSLKWIHFNILLEDGNVIFLEDNKEKRRIENFVPTIIVIKTNEKAFYKIHQYDSKWANTITKGKPTILTLPSNSEKKCVMLYVAVCDECFLNISLSDNKTIQVTGEPSTMITKPWQLQKVDIEPDKENTFRLYRGRNDDNVFGEWEIDVRWCPDIEKNNKVTYKTNSSKADQRNYTCHLLNQQDGELNSRVKKNDDVNTGFSCRPGSLGRECDIKCKDLLGPENKYCEEYRICENSECKCAWGFQGPSCEKSCSSGYWGLSCEKTCDSTCTECNRTTGECPKSEATVNLGDWSSDKLAIIGYAIIITIILVVLIIIVLIILEKRILLTDWIPENSPEQNALMS